MTCLTFLVAFNTNHWRRSTEAGRNEGWIRSIEDEPSLTFSRNFLRVRKLWSALLSNERLGIRPRILLLPLCTESWLGIGQSPVLVETYAFAHQSRSRWIQSDNQFTIDAFLYAEELMILATVVLMLVTLPVGWSFLVMDYRLEHFDWSFRVFLLTTALIPLDLICSLVRIVSRARKLRDTSVSSEALVCLRCPIAGTTPSVRIPSPTHPQTKKRWIFKHSSPVFFFPSLSLRRCVLFLSIT